MRGQPIKQTLRKEQTSPTNPQSKPPTPINSKRQTRSGRHVKTPTKFKDYVT